MTMTVDELAYQIFSVADRYGISSRALASPANYDLCELHNLPIDLLTPIQVQAATDMERAWSEGLANRVGKLNADRGQAFGPLNAKVDREPARGTDENRPTRKVVRAQVFGYPVTAVLRWMGANDWSFEDAGVALAYYGAGGISDTTIRIQLAAGKKGERGDPAPLTDAQIKQLKKATK